MKVTKSVFEFSDVRIREKPVKNLSVNIDMPDFTALKNGLRVYFVYTVSYDPSETYMRLGGYLELEGEDITAVSKEWVKNKKISGETGEGVLNLVNYHSCMNAVLLARIFNITPPLIPPMLRMGAGKTKNSK
jgi:hypothetical protein